MSLYLVPFPRYRHLSMKLELYVAKNDLELSLSWNTMVDSSPIVAINFVSRCDCSTGSCRIEFGYEKLISLGYRLWKLHVSTSSCLGIAGTKSTKVIDFTHLMSFMADPCEFMYAL